MHDLRSARFRTHWVRLVVVTVALAGMVAATVTVVTADPGSTTTAGTVEPEPPRGLLPDDDPFYDTPDGVDLAAVAPGEILRIRPLTVSAGFLPLPVDAWQVLVRSTDSDGDPVPVAASILLPVVPWTGNGPQPLVSYQSPIDALGDHCQPSYTLRTGNEPELAAMTPALLAGWAVVTTDFEGPRHAYGAGPMTAHGVLDGVRGALTLEQANLDATAPVGFVGYSGGGQATTWAAEVQPTYAPELNVVGFAGGGVPVDLQEVARHLDGDLAAGIAIAAGVGIDREFPAMDLENILNDRGREVMADVSDQCIDEFAFDYPGVTFADLSTHPDPLSLPQITDALDANSLGKATPSAPFYLWHSVADQLLPVSGPDRLAEYYCTDGDQPLYYDRNVAGEHITYAVAGAPGAFAFLADRFAGLPAPDNCALVPALTGSVVDDIVGSDDPVGELEAAIGEIAGDAPPGDTGNDNGDGDGGESRNKNKNKSKSGDDANHPGRVFGTEPPPGANDWNCEPPTAHPKPVVLVHGLGGSAQGNWSDFSPALASDGYCVFALDYGRRGDVPPPFERFGGLIPVQESADQLALFVDAVLEATGASHVDIVGHSEGSFMPNWFVKFGGGDAVVDRYVGLTPLWDGTNFLAGGTLTTAGRPSGLTDTFEDLFFEPTCQSCPQLLTGSPVVEQMNEGPTGPRVPGVTYTMIMTRLDELVIPYTSGIMEGATNIVIQDQCPIDVSEHIAVAVDPIVLANIRNALDPANATPVDCQTFLRGW